MLFIAREIYHGINYHEYNKRNAHNTLIPKKGSHDKLFPKRHLNRGRPQLRVVLVLIVKLLSRSCSVRVHCPNTRRSKTEGADGEI